jgi:polysaccharide export outer membrane protein
MNSLFNQNHFKTVNFVRASLLALMCIVLFADFAQAQQPPLIAPPVKENAKPTTKAEKPQTEKSQPAAPRSDASAATGHSTAQPAASTTTVSTPMKTVSAAMDVNEDKRYKIGPGDVLDIRVFNRPTLSRDNVRVDERGMITMPLIENEIDVKCRTENELSHEIATLYLKYQTHPHVDVFLKEYKSQPVAVIGAVNQPGRFQLQRRIRLLELLAYAGGPAIERAGRNIQLVHAAEPSMCDDPSEIPDNIVEQSFTTYKLNDTLKGFEAANPIVRPGDIVTIAIAEEVYVVGNVLRPTPIPLREPITISRAIAIAGGVAPDSKTESVRIVRQKPDSLEKEVIIVDLKKITKQQAPDVPLIANDVVEVPANGRKQFIRQLLGGGAASAAQLPLRVIP